jgi:hypothetical protein
VSLEPAFPSLILIMRRSLQGGLILAGLLSTAACSQPPNPIVARDPIPQPPPGYRVVCSSTSMPFYTVIADCDPVFVPIRKEERAVVRVKG